MNCLCVYFQVHQKLRANIQDHLQAFRSYAPGRWFYYNVADEPPALLKHIQWDVIIFHYTFFALKWMPPSFYSYARRVAFLKDVPAVKVAVPQDEYVYSEQMCDFFCEIGIESVITLTFERDWQTIYPKARSGLKNYLNTMAGFVDEHAASIFGPRAQPLAQRPLHIGYRARKLPYWLGFHGQLKWELGEIFSKHTKNLDLETDISCDPNKVFLGNSWYEFLLNCKTVLGCPSGASLHDPKGRIRHLVENFVGTDPSASFETVRAACFPEADGTIEYYPLSPRLFECCLTKTCQVLLEGDYQGIFLPNIHYIPIKTDWSNLDEVVAKIKDTEFCQTLVDRAYEDVVLSGKYTYQKFVKDAWAWIHRCNPKLTHGSGQGRMPLLRLESGLRKRTSQFQNGIRALAYWENRTRKRIFGH